MKKYIFSAILLVSSGAFISTTVQSCTTLATSDLGVSVIKRMLLGGIDKASTTFSNKDAFLQSNLIDKALPKQLKDINSVLEKVAPNLVAKEKDYIAQAAAFTVNTSTPILKDAVNTLNANDVTRIIQGEKGTATLILKEKTSEKLVAAIAPKVDEKLNEYGIARTINTALQGSNLLGSILGSQSSNNLATGGLSKLASEQMVNGLFNIVEDYEVQNYNSLIGNLTGKK